VDVDADGKSKAEAGVLGVFLAEPNPKAPDPRPNALEAPVRVVVAVGDGMFVVAMGGMLLNGLERVESKRLAVLSPFLGMLAQ